MQAEKGAGPNERFRYLLEDTTSTIAIVALQPHPAYMHASPSGELSASDALRPRICDGEEALPGQQEGPPNANDDAPSSPVIVRHKAGRLGQSGHRIDSEDTESEVEEFESDSDDDSDEDFEQNQPPGSKGQQAPPQIRLPAQDERWLMENAPTRDQQHALQAQEVWAHLQSSFSLLSLSATMRNGPFS